MSKVLVTPMYCPYRFNGMICKLRPLKGKHKYGHHFCVNTKKFPKACPLPSVTIYSNEIIRKTLVVNHTTVVRIFGWLKLYFKH